MTRDRAVNLVTQALDQAGPIDNTLSNHAFAQRLATALSAIGFLALADDPAQPSQRVHHERTSALAEHPPQPRGPARLQEQDDAQPLHSELRPTAWAVQRNRELYPQTPTQQKLQQHLSPATSVAQPKPAAAETRTETTTES